MYTSSLQVCAQMKSIPGLVLDLRYSALDYKKNIRRFVILLYFSVSFVYAALYVNALT